MRIVEFIINTWFKIKFFIITCFVDISKRHTDYNNYNLSMSERFDNLDNWDLIAPWGSFNTLVPNSNYAFYPECVQLSTAGVEINAVKQDEYNKAGMLYSKWSFVYGKLISKIQFDDKPGSWQAFWLLSDNQQKDYRNIDYLLPEFDFEYCGNWKHSISATQHYGYDYESKRSTRRNKISGLKFYPGNKFYEYAFEITPYRVIWRINGIAVKIMYRAASSNLKRVLLDNKTSTKSGYCSYNYLGPESKTKVAFVKLYHHDNDKF